MKKVLSIFLFGLVLVISGIVLSKTIFKPKPIHIHAGFQIYKDEKLLDFSDFKYMHELPCTLNGKPVEGAKPDEQLEKAHLHDQTGDIVHIHRNDAEWNDLFTNLKYKIDEKAVGYINGKRHDNFLDTEIEPYDSIVVFIGKNADDKKFLKSAIKKEYIQKIEKKSETCSS